MKNLFFLLLILLLSSCTNQELGWFILSPNNIEGLTNLKFLLSGLTTTIYISVISIIISAVILKSLEKSLKIRKYEADENPIVDPHIDVVNHESAIRAIGFLFYLSDNEKMTNFPRQGVGVESIKGRVVIYPPTWEYPIIENMPDEGTKYNLQTYLHYA